MGKSCAVLGCNTGYKVRKKDSEKDKEAKKRTIFAFPDAEKEPERLRDWLRRISRADFDPRGKETGVCIQHFKDNFVTYERVDWKRADKQKDWPLERPKLAANAVPTENLGHEQASASHISPRALTEPKLRRRKRELEEAEAVETAETAGPSKFPRPELTLDDIKDYVVDISRQEDIPYENRYEPGRGLHIFRVAMDDSIRIVGSVLFREDLSWKLSVDGKHKPEYEQMAFISPDMVPIAGVSSLNHVKSLLEVLNAAIKKEENKPITPENTPNDATEMLDAIEQVVKKTKDKLLTKLGENTEGEEEEAEEEKEAEHVPEDDQEGTEEENAEEKRAKKELKKIERLEYPLEQLRLLLRKPKGRRYSSLQLSTALMLRLSSRSGYERLRKMDHVALPSSSTLDTVTKGINADLGKLLQQRLKTFKNPKEATVNVVFDEVAVREGLELVGSSGKLIGVTEEGELATKCLVFMAVSLHGSFAEAVHFVPARGNLKGPEIANLLRQVAENLFAMGYTVKLSCSDNHPANASAVKILCKDSPDGTYWDCQGHKVFAVMDHVHNLKNVFNNWLDRERFEFPDMTVTFSRGKDKYPLQVTARYASMSCVREAWDRERRTNPAVATAYKITANTFAPSPLQKTSAKWALAIFNEKTIGMLLTQAETLEMPPEKVEAYHQTAAFIRRILNIWEIQNVRTPHKGQKKRSQNMRPFKESTDSRLALLSEYADWIQAWQEGAKGGRTGLTRETGTAMQQTLRGQVALVRHCLDELAFKYVLLGKTSSDSIERRFGWYRQCKGGCYYISLKDVFDAERKIRALTFLRYVKESELDLKALAAETRAGAEEERAEAKAQAAAAATRINEALPIRPMPREVELLSCQSLHYTAGFVCHAELKRTACAECEELLIKAEAGCLPPLMLEEEAGIDAEIYEMSGVYTEYVSRGGLKTPSLLAYALAKYCAEKWYQLRDDKACFKQFLTVDKGNKNVYHREVFVQLVLTYLKEDTALEESFRVDYKCGLGHSIVYEFCTRFFNLFCHYYILQRKGLAPKTDSQDKGEKLQSKTKRRRK